jgi:dihydrofolate synthase/folylpolyglutamate synthase
LGETLPEITRQKAGIIQPENEIFMYDQAAEIMDVIIETADEKRAPLHLASATKFDGLPDFQSRNAGLALEAVKFVLARDDEEPLTKAEIDEALQVAIPARAEEFDYHGKKVIIDAAHNPQKLQAFADHIKQCGAGQKITLVVSLGSNKAASVLEDMQILHQIADSVILTTFKDTSVETHFRESLPLKTLGDAAQKAGFSDIQVVADSIDALNEAAKKADGIVVATGSFFLLNRIRPVLLQA